MIMKHSGLTLIELMVTLALLSVLMAVGIPQFTSSTANSRLTSAINALSGDLSFARTEAIKRGESITVTGAANWATSGWTITVTSGGATLRTSPALTAGATIATLPSNTTSVIFRANGRSSSAVEFDLCDARSGLFGKKITLNSTGQIILQTKRQCN